MSSDDSEGLPSDVLAAFPFPRANTKVFASGGPPSEHAWVDAGCWWGHALSYKEAADCLVDGVLNERIKMESVSPILFLYRHYLELSLKAMAHQLATEQQFKALQHDLKAAWSFVCSQCSVTVQDPDTAGANAIIEDWARVDAGSFAFRYPTTKAGAPALHPDLRAFVNIRKVSEDMSAIANYFSVLDSLIYDIVCASEDAREGY